MKYFIGSLNRPQANLLKRFKTIALISGLFLLLSPVMAQYANVPATGYNNDIVANGGGASGTPNTGVSFPAIGIDGAQYCLVSQGYLAGSLTPTCFMPVSGTATSLLTPAVTYTFQGYGTSALNNNNALTITSPSSFYTSPFPSTGTLTLNTPAIYGKLYVLVESVVNNGSTQTMTATVTFTDASTQVFSGNSFANWFSGSATTTAFAGFNRVNPTNSAFLNVCAAGTYTTSPSMFEMALTISAANLGKQVQSISFTNTSTSTTGSTPTSVNYLHIMAVSGIAPCPVPVAQPVSLGFSGVTLTAIGGSFTPAIGAPNGYLVVRYPAGAVETQPAAGITYTTGQSLGLGTVVQSGASASFTATGLFGSTPYDFYVYSFNSSATCSGPIYFTTGGFFGTQSTSPCGTLTGNIPVGPTAPASPAGFPTLTAALNYININGLGGATVLELQQDYVSGASEPSYPITFASNPCVGPVNTLTIRPASTVITPLTISPGAAGNPTAILDLNGAQYVTIDGRPGGAGIPKLSIVNASVSAISTIRLINEASNNVIAYCDVQGACTTGAANPATNGVIFIGGTTGTNGNDNNSIISCDVHGVGANLPGVGIAAQNSSTAGSAANNDNNTITGCNVFDFYHTTLASAGILVAAGNNNFTITNNKLYQTASRTYTGTQTVRAFWITPNTASLTSASGFDITGNTIGFATAAGTGTLTMTGTTAWLFNGMDLSLGIGSASTVQNNTITNINQTTGNAGSTAFIGINVANGNLNITNNTIGSETTNGAITFTASANTGGAIGIRTGAGQTLNITGNKVSGFTLLASALTVTPIFNGIAASGGTTLTISNNIIGSATTANSIQLPGLSTSTSVQSVRGIIVNPASGTSTVSGNLIANISTGIVASGAQANTLVGISVTTTSSTVSNNTIRNLTSTSQTTSGGSTASVIGIAFSSASAPAVISGNTIHTLKNTHATTISGPVVAGIYYSGASGASNLIEKNFIHSLSIASSTVSTAAAITGMDIATGQVTIRNNMIRLGIDENGNSVNCPTLIRGITKNANIASIYFNSIYIGGNVTVTTPAANTFAFTRTASATGDDIRNNIFVNNRTNSTTGGKHYQINLVNTSTLNLNNNIYFGSGNGTVFGFNGTTDIGAYSPNWVSGDVFSRAMDPRFISPAGATANLHIQAPPVVTPVEGLGVDIPSVTQDFDGDTRSSFSPVDIGADAGNFTSIPACATPSGTALTLTPFSLFQINGTFTNVGSDAYLVVRYLSPATPVVDPSNGSYYPVGSSLGGGTVIAIVPAAGPYSFSAAGLSLATNYTFYVYPYNSVCAGGPLYASAVPQSASTLACSLAGGIVKIGPGAPASPAGFPTLTAALTFISNNGLTGPTTLELRNDYVSSSETFPITIGNLPCISSTNTLTIRPEAGANGKIITSGNAGPAIDFSGAQFVTIDGRPGGAGASISVTAAGALNSLNLNIVNTNTAGAAVRLDNQSQNNTIKFCDLQGTNTTTANVPGTLAGVVCFGNVVGSNGNDNNTVDNCNIHSTSAVSWPTMGVYAFGPTSRSTLGTDYNDNNTVSNNNIYDYHSLTLPTVGVEVERGCNAWSITGNSFFQTATRVPTTAALTSRAIYVAPSTGTTTVGNGFTISGNYIGGSLPLCNGTAYTCSTATSHTFRAIDLAVNGGSASNVKSNTIQNIKLTENGTADLMAGIWLSQSGSVNIGGPLPTDGNLIGSTVSTGNIQLHNTNAGITPAHMIIMTSGVGTAAQILVQNNKVGGISLDGAGSCFSGIYCAGAAQFTIKDNLVGSTTVANSIIQINNTSTREQWLRGIHVPSASSVLNISNNTIANLTNNGTSTVTLDGNGTNGNVCQAIGMYLISTSTTGAIVTGNTIFNIASAAQQTSTGTSVAVGGISLSHTAAATTGALISGNTVHSLSSTSVSMSARTSMQGIFFHGLSTATTTVSKNFVHSFDVTSPTNTVSRFFGIFFNNGVANCVNNMVRFGIKPDGTSLTTPCEINGITAGGPRTSGNIYNIYHNTVYIGGTNVAVANANNTLAFYRSNSGGAPATTDIRNNIFINNRSNAAAGGGKHYQLFFFVDPNTSASLNTNIYQGTGTGAVFAYDGTNDIPNYSTLWFPSDINSYDEDPMLVNTTGNLSAVNLHLMPSTPTRAEQFGQFVSGAADDFDGEDRSTLSPVDIGADAGNYTALFYCGGSPLAATAVLTNTIPICGSGSRTIVLQGITATPGFTYQWKESTTGVAGTFQKILGATNSSYTSPVLTQTMYYLCEVSCDSSELTTPSTIVAIEINQSPVVTITPGSGNVCSGSTVSLAASGAATYVWTASNASGMAAVYLITSSMNLPTITSVPTSTTNGTSTPAWTYRVTGTSAAGCVGAQVTAVLNVISTPVVPQTLTYTQSPDPTCAPGVPVTLTVNNTGTIGAGQWIYNWYDQAGTTLLQTTTTSSSTNSYTPPTPALNGNYVYTATVTNSLCPYSYAQTSPTFFAGYTSTKIITNANCGNNGTITVLPSGQNNFTTWYANDFATGLQNSPTLDQAFGTTVFTSGDCRLTANTASNQGAFLVRNPAGINTNNLQIDFTLTTSPRSSGTAGFYGADGMAWSYAPDVYPGLVTIGTSGFYPENGTGSGIRLAFDAVNNGTNNLTGVYLMYNCGIPNQGPTTDGVIAFKGGTFWQGLTNAPISIVISEDGYVSVRLNSILIFDHVQLPAAYLAANKSTWYHAFSGRTGASYEVHALDNLKIRFNSYEFSSNSTNGLNGTWQASNVLGGLAAGTHPVWVRNPSDITCAVNTGNAVITNVASPSSATTVTVTGNNPILCSGSVLNLTTDVFVPGAVFLWESAPSASGPWTPAAGVNTTRVYTTSPLNEDTWFRCNFTCPSSTMITAAPLLADVNVGTVASVNGPYAINCVGKPITMNVTPGANTTLIWYAAASGGSPLATGNTYSDVPATLPQTYYVEPTTTLLSNHYYHGGLSEFVADFGTQSNTTTALGNTLRFTTTSNVRIDSIKVFPTAVGLITVALQASGSSTNIGTPYSMVITTSMVNKFTNVPVSFDLVGGGNYQLSLTSNLACRYYTGYTGPYSSSGIPYMNMGGDILDITGSANTPTAATVTSIYSGIWDINISTSCASVVGSRIPVVVSLTPAYAVDVTPGTAALCQGGIQALSASSTTSYSNYSWSPAANLYTDAAATIPYILNAHATTVYARSLTTGSGNFIVTASGSQDGCSNTDTANITVTDAPPVLVTSSTTSVCPGGSAVLNASSANAGYSYTWSPGGSTSASASVNPSVHTNYTVNAVDNTNGINKGCVTSAIQSVGVKKVGVSATADPVGICSGDNSHLYAVASTSSLYLLDAATPSPVPIPGGGITLLNNGVGLAAGNFNDGYWNVNLPFNFSFFGDLFNSVSVNTNGFITFGGGSTASVPGVIPNATEPNNAIYLAAKDWTMVSGGVIRCFTVGAAPNRRFVLDYLNIPSVSATGNLNGQIILSESDGRINLILSTTDASSFKTLGIENANGTTANAPGLRNGNSWTISSAEGWEFSPIGGSLTYAWTPAANLDDPTIPNPIASSIFTSTTFSVTVSDLIGGCSATATTLVTTGDPLSAIPVADPASICVGQSTTLSVTPTGGCSPYSYSWDDGVNILSNTNFVGVAPTTTTDYNLTVIDNASNAYFYTITIVVNPTPAVSVTPGLICGTGNTTLTASGASTYTWSPSTGLNTTSGASVIATSTVNRVYTVTGTSAEGCTNTATSQVTVANPVTVQATAVPNQINPGHNAQLTATGLLQGSGYTVGSIPHTPESATLPNAGPTGDEGNTNATIPFAFNFFGTSYSDFTIHTNGQILMGANRTESTNQYYPATNHTNIPSASNPNNWVGFWADLSPAAGQITWGIVGSAPNRKLVVRWTNATWFSSGPSPLNYQIELNETSNIIDVFLTSVNGGSLATNHSRLVALENSTGTLGVAPAGHTPAAGLWNATNEGWRFAPSATGITYSWSPATFLTNPSIANPVAQNMTGTTVYTVTATSGAGCTASTQVTVNVGIPLAVTSSSSASNFCQGGSTTLSATATGGGLPYAGYSWSDGTTTVGTGSSLSVIPSAGTTTYTVTITDADGFTATSSVPVTVKPNPVVTLSKSGDVCGAGSVTLTVTGTANSYTWSPSPTLVVNSPGDNATATPTVTTTYGVSGTLNGCSTSATVGVNVYSTVTVSAAASPSTICFNGTSQLNATPATGLSYSWSPSAFLSATNISNPVATAVTSTTTYTVTATHPTTGCSGTAQVTLQAGTPVAITVAATAPVICAGATTTLNSAVIGGGTPYTYSWKAGSTVVGATQNIAVTPSVTTTYTLFVTDACGSVTSSDEVVIQVNPLPVVGVTPGNSSLCTGVSTSADLTASGADNYAWSPAAGLSATTGSNVTASPVFSTVYTVTGTFTSTGCSATAMAVVNVSDLSATAQAYGYEACHGGNSQLFAYAGNSASNYALTSIPFAAVPVTGATAITTWANTDIDDGSSGPINLPFSFNFYGTNYNQIWVGTNGYISFSDLSTISGLNSRKAANLTTSTAANNVVALCYSDLHAGNGGGSVKYLVSGTAPTRVFTVVFDQVFLTNTGRVKGQIQLFENTNVIEVHVEQITHGTSASQNALGVENANGSQRMIPASRMPGVWNVNAGSPEAWRFSPNAGYTFSWSPSTFLSNTGIANPMISGFNSTTVYTVVATETSSGCQSIDTVRVTDVPLPTATLSGVAEICHGSAATLNFAFTGNAPFTYSFTDGTNMFGPFSSANATATQSVSPLTTSTYSLVSIDDKFCSGSVSGSAVITVDSHAPVISCPAPVTANTDPGFGYATNVNLGTPVVTDNCSFLVTNNAPFTFLLGTTTVTWTATDSHGNTSTCAQLVTVSDNQAPIVNCPPTVIIPADAGECFSSQVDLGTLDAIDNDGVANIVNNGLSQYPVGSTTVIWTATDLSGNTSTCAQTVTVVDEQLPEITCPAPVSAFTAPGQCHAAGVVLGTPVTSDNCSVLSVSSDAPALFPAGETTVTWTVEDASGNTATCTQSVTVTDNQAPVFAGCPASFSSCPPINWTPPTVSDNCTPAGSILVTSNYSPGSSFPAGTTVVTYTATDGNGNTTACSFSVTRIEPSSIAGITLTSNKPFNNICLGDNITLSLNGITASSLGAGAQWKWYSGSCGGTPVPGSSNQTSITVNPASNTTYYVRAEGPCNTTTCLSLTVVVTTVPPSGNPGLVYAPVIAFAGATDSIIVNAVPGATFYHWTTSGNSNILFNGQPAPYESTSPKVTLTFVSPSTQGSGIGNYHIQFFAGNACGITNSNNVRIRATVSTPELAAGTLVACSGQTKTFSILPVIGAKTYEWSFASGSGTIVGNGTQTVNVTFTSLPAVLCVHGVTANNTPGPDLCLNISTVTAVPAAISGNGTPCQGGTEIYSIPAVSGAISYNWTTTVPGASITGSGTTATVVYPSGTFTGDVCVTAYSGCGTSAPSCLSIVAGTIPPLGSITGIADGLCGATAVNYQVPSTGATSYLWAVPAGALITAGQGTNSILVDFSAGFTGGFITLSSNNSCGVASGSLAVTGAPGLAQITGSTSVCAEDVEVYVATSQGATSYTWDIDPLEGNIIPMVNANEIMVEWLTNGGTVKVTTSNACGTSAQALLVVGSSCRLAADQTLVETLQATVYPNPSQGRLTLEYSSPEEAAYGLRITDLTGRIIQQQDLLAMNGLNRHDIDLSHVSKGVYMLSLQNTKGENLVIRIVID